MNSLIFFGSDRYSAITLSSLLASSVYHLVTVVTDKQVGGSPVEQLARTHNLPVTYYPTTPEEKGKFMSHLESISSLLESNTPPLGLCASFDHLIPKDIIKLFGGNLYNLHPSLLPQYRNVSPVQYAIALGDKVTGITLFRISPGIDDGEIIVQAEEPISEDDTTPTLTPRLFARGAELFIASTKNDLNPLASNISLLESTPLIFTRRLTRDSGYIEWSVLHRLLKNEPVSIGESANELLNLRLEREKINSSQLPSSIYLLDLMRALTPWPTVWSTVPTKKGELRITLVATTPLSSLLAPRILLAGKPRPISYQQFHDAYL